MQLTVKSANADTHLPLLLLHGNPGVGQVVGAGDVEPRLAHHQHHLRCHRGPLGPAHCRPRARPLSTTGAPESLLISRESHRSTFSLRRSTSVTTLVTNSLNDVNAKHEKDGETLGGNTISRKHLI